MKNLFILLFGILIMVGCSKPPVHECQYLVNALDCNIEYYTEEGIETLSFTDPDNLITYESEVFEITDFAYIKIVRNNHLSIGSISILVNGEHVKYAFCDHYQDSITLTYFVE